MPDLLHPPPRLALAIMLALAAMIGPAARDAARAQSPDIHADAARCAALRALPGEGCRIAAVNARAEFQEKAPRFATRAACETRFGRGACLIVIGGSGPDGVSHAPRMAGFRLSARGGAALVTPVAAGRGPAIAFRPRAADQPDAVIDEGRGASARAAWMARHAPARRGGGRDRPYSPADGGAGAQLDLRDPGPEAGPAARFPVSPERLRQMREDADRAARVRR